MFVVDKVKIVKICSLESSTNLHNICNDQNAHHVQPCPLYSARANLLPPSSSSPPPELQLKLNYN